MKLEYEQSDEDLLFLLQHDGDGFNRWDAGQRLMLRWIDRARVGRFRLAAAEQQALSALLADTQLDPAMVAYLLNLPSEAYIAEFSAVIDPLAIHGARRQVQQALAVALASDFAACYQRLHSTAPYQPEPAAMAARSLKNLALSYWVKSSAEGMAQARRQYQQADNMTDQMAALVALVNSGERVQAEALLADFWQRWQHDPLVVNQWLAVQAGSAEFGTVEQVQALLQHEAFDWRNPNKVRSVLGAFANQSLVNFHRADGAGYDLLADAVLKLNDSNPQIAARLLTPLTRWQRLVPAAGQVMKARLQRIKEHGSLSKDVYEVVSKSLI